jgi:hypothetical protein
MQQTDSLLSVYGPWTFSMWLQSWYIPIQTSFIATERTTYPDYRTPQVRWDATCLCSASACRDNFTCRWFKIVWYSHTHVDKWAGIAQSVNTAVTGWLTKVQCVSGEDLSVCCLIKTGCDAHTYTYPMGTEGILPRGTVVRTWRWLVIAIQCQSLECVELYIVRFS